MEESQILSHLTKVNRVLQSAGLQNTVLVVEDWRVLPCRLAVIAADPNVAIPRTKEDREVFQLRFVYFLKVRVDPTPTWNPTMSRSPVDRRASTSRLRLTAQGCSLYGVEKNPAFGGFTAPLGGIGTGLSLWPSYRLQVNIPPTFQSLHIHSRDVDRPRFALCNMGQVENGRIGNLKVFCSHLGLITSTVQSHGPVRLGGRTPHDELRGGYTSGK